MGIFERETGIKIKFVETDPATEYQTNIRNASTKNGSFDCVTGAIEDTGDYANAGLLRPLDDYVAKYRPSWNDPKYGYAGGRSTVKLFTQYNGQTYWVAFDNDTQPFVYRADLFNDPKEKAAFEDKYGQPLVFPKTWNDQAKIAEFFTRPNAAIAAVRLGRAEGPVLGQGQLEAPVRQLGADPNMYYFKPDGSANVNNAAGIRACNRASAVAAVVGAGQPRPRTGSRSTQLRRRQRCPGWLVRERHEDPPGEQGPRHGRVRQVPPHRACSRAGSSTASSSAASRCTTTSRTA